MSLPRTLLKRGAAIFSTVAITLLLLSVIAGASGLEERILKGVTILVQIRNQDGSVFLCQAMVLYHNFSHRFRGAPPNTA